MALAEEVVFWDQAQSRSFAGRAAVEAVWQALFADGFAEVRIEAHVAQSGRPRLVGRERPGEREHEEGERDGSHFAASLATSSIARPIGMWTTPAARSSQP